MIRQTGLSKGLSNGQGRDGSGRVVGARKTIRLPPPTSVAPATFIAIEPAVVDDQVPVLDLDQRLELLGRVADHLDAGQDEVAPLDLDQGIGGHPLGMGPLGGLAPGRRGSSRR